MAQTPMIRIEGLKKIYGSGQTAVAALGGVKLLRDAKEFTAGR